MRRRRSSFNRESRTVGRGRGTRSGEGGARRWPELRASAWAAAGGRSWRRCSGAARCPPAPRPPYSHSARLLLILPTQPRIARRGTACTRARPGRGAVENNHSTAYRRTQHDLQCRCSCRRATRFAMEYSRPSHERVPSAGMGNPVVVFRPFNRSSRCCQLSDPAGGRDGPGNAGGSASERRAPAAAVTSAVVTRHYGGAIAEHSSPASGSGQGLTLVHFSAQLERFVWDRGCAQGMCSPCKGGVKGCSGCVGCVPVSDTAQVKLRSGRV